MAKIKGTFHEMEIPDNREIIQTDTLRLPWKEDKACYFLIRIANGKIHCGFLSGHVMAVEFVGKDPFNMIKEIARRGLINQEHMGYVACEIMRASICLEGNEEFIQR